MITSKKKSYMNITAKRIAVKYILKPVNISLNGKETVFCKENDIEILNYTTNCVYRIISNNRIFYFREARKHETQINYIKTLVREYFEKKEDKYDDEVFLYKCFSDKTNLKKIFNMGIVNDEQSSVRRFFDYYDASAIGIDTVDLNRIKRLRGFVRFCWGQLDQYSLNVGLRVGQYETYNAERSIATKIIADLIGLNKYIPNTRYAIVKSGMLTKFGVIMDNCEGICPNTLSHIERKKMCTPILQHYLNNLNLLDVLCSEKDHRPCNYNIKLKNDKVVGVMAFDNNAPATFSLPFVSFKTYAGCSEYFIHNFINRPYVDRKICENIIKLKYKDVMTKLKPIVNMNIILMMLFRLYKVKTILKKSIKLKKVRLLDDSEWNDCTLKEEMSGKYGKTYLLLFVQNNWLKPQPWLLDK